MNPQEGLVMNPQNNRKKIALIIGSILLVVLIAVFSVLLLVNFNKKDNTTTNTTKTTAKETVALAHTFFTTDATTKSFTFLPPAENQKESILVADTNTGVALLSDTGTFVDFQQTDIVSTDDLNNIINSVKKFFTDNGFNESKSVNANPTVKLRYSSDNVQCQFSHFADDKKTNNGFQLTCSNESDHKNDLALVDQLINLWKKPATFDYVMQDGLSDDKYTVKTINTINTADPTKSHTLLYANDEGTWVYIADATEGDTSLSNGKYIINDDLKKGLANAHYGPLLTKYLSTAKK